MSEPEQREMEELAYQSARRLQKRIEDIQAEVNRLLQIITRADHPLGPPASEDWTR